MTKVLISYRRKDTAPIAGRLFDRLAKELGRDCVFMDIDTIRPGFDFVAEISKAIASADVVLALIGDEWSTQMDASGNRRIEKDDDPVRMEIAAALRANVRVIPVLVGNAHMPGASELPMNLAPLSRLHALALDPGRRFHVDVDDLITSLQTDSRNSHSQVAQTKVPTRLVLCAALLFGTTALLMALWPQNEPDRSPVADNPPDITTGTAEPNPLALRLDPIPMRNGQFVSSVTFSPDSEMLATTNSNKTVSLWAVLTGEEMFRLRPADTDAITAAVFSPNGDSLATRALKTQIAVWNTRDGSERFRYSSSEKFGLNNGLAFTPNGQQIVTANESGAIQIRDVSDGRLIRQINGEKHANSLTVSRDGSMLAVGFSGNDSQGVAAIWKINNGAKMAAFRHPAPVFKVAFSPNGRTLAVGWGRASGVGGATLWDVKTGKETGILGSGGRTLRDRLETGVVNIAFNSNGRLVATQSFDGSGMVRIWDTQSLEEVTRFEHSRGVRDFTFSPDDQWIASSTYGGTIHIWEVATGRQLLRTTHEFEVHEVAFSANGQFIAGAAMSGVLYRVESENVP